MKKILYCFSVPPQPGGIRNRHLAIAFGTAAGSVAILFIGVGLVLWRRHKHNQQVFFDVNGKRTFFLFGLWGDFMHTP